ncbi:hypothetical protein [Ferruginibacter sp.]|nr:hypothetical protein [Ferruginibacter sp.]
MNKKKRIIIVVVLMLIAALLIYFLCCRKKTANIKYNLQGATTLNYGDIKLTIWDNNTEDGDSVKVYLDDKIIRDTIGLLYEPLTLNFGKLSKGEHLLGVVAINEGTTSPASATIGLSNETEKNEFEMNATKDSAASWKIIIK